MKAGQFLSIAIGVVLLYLVFRKKSSASALNKDGASSGTDATSGGSATPNTGGASSTQTATPIGSNDSYPIKVVTPYRTPYTRSGDTPPASKVAPVMIPYTAKQYNLSPYKTPYSSTGYAAIGSDFL